MNKNDKGALNIYLKDISEGPLLTDEEELRLAEQIENGDAGAVQKLINSNLRFVVSVAKGYTGQGLRLDDLISEGNMGLMKAASKYRASYRKRFVTFAAPYVRQCIEAVIDQQAGLYKIPSGEAPKSEKKRNYPVSVDAPIPAGSQNNFNLLSILENPNSPHADSLLEQSGTTEELLALLTPLDAREQQVIKSVYGLGCERQTMAEVAMDMGLKRERVRQIRDKALRKLKKLKARTGAE